jgi:hypothetical protein
MTPHQLGLAAASTFVGIDTQRYVDCGNLPYGEGHPMTPERLAELQELARSCSTNDDRQYGWFCELFNEIERLQNVKPAPTYEQVRRVLAKHFFTVNSASLLADALKTSGLLSDSSREPGWYWVRRSEGEPWEAVCWTGREWYAHTWQGNVVPFKIGTKLPDPDA